jgi:hypothetical protein
MDMARSVTAFVVASTLVFSTISPGNALMIIGPPPPPPPPPSSSAVLGVGGGLAVGIIATAGLLCIYDIWLKINGLKNWDGSPKVVQAQIHHHRRP